MLYNARMRHALKRHPDSLGTAAAHVEVEIARPRAGLLSVSYVVTGRIADILLPKALPPARADELWQHTCFEAFVRAPSGDAYYEFNVSPSTRWAAYRFDGYRRGMRAAAEIDAVPVEVEAGRDRYRLKASFELFRLPDLGGETAWRLGLSVLIDDANGRRSYFALAHPPGQPDFHHADGFTLEFSPAVAS